MNSVIRIALSFLREEEAATATEYAFMLALIIVVCIGAVSALGSKVSGTFATTSTKIP